MDAREGRFGRIDDHARGFEVVPAKHCEHAIAVGPKYGLMHGCLLLL
jgi:hypothetical protein